MNYRRSILALLAYLLVFVISAIIYTRIEFNECGPLPIQESLYFSAVTITTLGYGDILPTLPNSRTVAALEAMFGVLIFGGFLLQLGIEISNNAERKQIELQKNKLSRHYFVFRKRILTHFVWSLNEYKSKFGKNKEYKKSSEFVSLVDSLTDIRVYEDYMHENNAERLHLLTTPTIIPVDILTKIHTETERFLQMLDLFLNTIPFNQREADEWMTHLQSDLSLYYANDDTDGHMTSIDHLHDFLCRTGAIKENQNTVFQYYLDKL